MEPQRLTTVLIFLVPQILALIAAEYGASDEEAAEMLYTSRLYSGLEDEATKLWHLSAHALFELFKEERQTGAITYPEEG